MINFLKRWWLRTKIRELQESYEWDYVMLGYYKDNAFAYNVQLRALKFKLITLSK